jgi:hypothetical protein
MTDVLTNILQWIVPSGGLGAVIAWLVSSRIRNTKTAKEVHDVYKAMYEDVQRSLIDLRNENERLYKAFIRLERAIRAATLCPNYHSCPVRAELSDDKGCDKRKRGKKPVGQPVAQDAHSEGDPCACADGEPVDTGKEPL